MIDGEVGIALVSGDRERFRVAAREAIVDPWNEWGFGAAGVLVAARLLGEDDIARAAIGRLWATWSFDSKARACLWTQKWDGRSEQFLGFAHGRVGNAYALLSTIRLQGLAHQAELLQRVVEALERTAIREGKLVNWLPTIGSDGSDVRVQWCHGVPGWSARSRVRRPIPASPRRSPARGRRRSSGKPGPCAAGPASATRRPATGGPSSS